MKGKDVDLWEAPRDIRRASEGHPKDIRHPLERLPLRLRFGRRGPDDDSKWRVRVRICGSSDGSNRCNCTFEGRYKRCVTRVLFRDPLGQTATRAVGTSRKSATPFGIAPTCMHLKCFAHQYFLAVISREILLTLTVIAINVPCTSKDYISLRSARRTSMRVARAAGRHPESMATPSEIPQATAVK